MFVSGLKSNYGTTPIPSTGESSPSSSVCPICPICIPWRPDVPQSRQALVDVRTLLPWNFLGKQPTGWSTSEILGISSVVVPKKIPCFIHFTIFHTFPSSGYNPSILCHSNLLLVCQIRSFFHGQIPTFTMSKALKIIPWSPVVSQAISGGLQSWFGMWTHGCPPKKNVYLIFKQTHITNQ